MHINKPGGFWKGFAIGAVAGAVTAATGGAAAVYLSTGSFAGAFTSAAVITATSSLGGGAVAGFAGSAFGSPILGLGNQAAFNESYKWSNYGRDLLIGTAAGAASGQIAKWFKAKFPNRTKTVTEKVTHVFDDQYYQTGRALPGEVISEVSGSNIAWEHTLEGVEITVSKGFQRSEAINLIFADRRLFMNWVRANQSLSRINNPLSLGETQDLLSTAKNLGITKFDFNSDGLLGLEKQLSWPHFKIQNLHIPIDQSAANYLLSIFKQ